MDALKLSKLRLGEKTLNSLLLQLIFLSGPKSCVLSTACLSFGRTAMILLGGLSIHALGSSIWSTMEKQIQIDIHVLYFAKFVFLRFPKKIVMPVVQVWRLTAALPNNDNDEDKAHSA